MSWNDLDMPDLPFKKPEELERIEALSKEQRDSKPAYEREQLIQEAANSIAERYQRRNKKDYAGCITLVETLLKEMGAALGGDFGASMVGLSSQKAEEAAKRVYEKVYFEPE